MICCTRVTIHSDPCKQLVHSTLTFTQLPTPANKVAGQVLRGLSRCWKSSSATCSQQLPKLFARIRKSPQDTMSCGLRIVVPRGRLELPLLSKTDFESAASTDSATGARWRRSIGMHLASVNRCEWCDWLSVSSWTNGQWQRCWYPAFIARLKLESLAIIKSTEYGI